MNASIQPSLNSPLDFQRLTVPVELVLNELPDPVLILDPDLRLLASNRSAAMVLGLTTHPFGNAPIRNLPVCRQHGAGDTSRLNPTTCLPCCLRHVAEVARQGSPANQFCILEEHRRANQMFRLIGRPWTVDSRPLIFLLMESCGDQIRRSFLEAFLNRRVKALVEHSQSLLVYSSLKDPLTGEQDVRVLLDLLSSEIAFFQLAERAMSGSPGLIQDLVNTADLSGMLAKQVRIFDSFGPSSIEFLSSSRELVLSGNDQVIQQILFGLVRGALERFGSRIHLQVGWAPHGNQARFSIRIQGQPNPDLIHRCFFPSSQDLENEKGWWIFGSRIMAECLAGGLAGYFFPTPTETVIYVEFPLLPDFPGSA